MRKTIPLIALLIAMCFILTACGSFMEWGDEEEKQIERIDKHTDANGVVYMDIYFVGEETPQSIPLPSGADGTSISFDATYNNDERKTVVTVSFSDGSADQTFDIKDGQSITSVSISEGEIGIGDVLCFYCGNDLVGEIPMSQIRGKDGATWLTGTSAPDNAVGKDGDFFLNTDKFDVYIKKGETWTTVGNLTGAGIDKIETYESADGSGIKITYNEQSGWEPTIVLCPGITDINLKLSEDKKQFVFEVVLSNGIVDENGVAQTFSKEFAIARFPQWESGTNFPSENDGIIGDFYFYEPTQTILHKKSTGWVTIISFNELLNQENDKVNVTFDALGGKMAITGFTNPTEKYEMTVTKGSFVHADLIPIPTKDGFTFGGWYTVPDPNPLVNGRFTDMVPVSQNITLYAYWIPNATSN